MKFNWDASTYHRISDAQESWGHETIEYRKWKGNETVLDAGCGSGRLTKILSIKVPHGKVIAVDSDLSMIRLAKENLVKFSNIEFTHMDISEIKLEEKVDVVFSNAVLHWILNHKKVFERFCQTLNCDGQLLIQCGGYGNLAKTLSILNKVSKSKEFYNYFCNNKGENIWNQTWYFAKNEDTEKILKEIGFRNIQVFIKNKEQKFRNKEEYFLFIKTIVLIPYLKYLPNDMLKDKFAKSVVEEIETNAKELQWKLDFVRLNINAIK
ncbi:MAG TPA: methyltransferase domain-containing protein [Nitrososphaeraceae archaeon]|nr:methyltransferase domain-containing protein [Nitrososphaeraceae archaeon]